MIEIKDIIIERYINEMGSTAFCVYSYVKMICDGEEKKFLLGKIMETLNLSKPAVIAALKTLRKYKLLSINKKIEGGKKKLYLKILTADKDSLLVLTTTKYKYNSNNIIITNKKYKDTRYFELFQKIMLYLLKHPRYCNKYYWNRCYKFEEKQNIHVKNIRNEISNIKLFLKWFLKEKSGKFSGLNIGLIAYMIEEYNIKNKTYKIVDKKKEKKENKKISRVKQEQAKELINDIENEKKLNKIDTQFLDECLENRIVKKTKKGYELNA